MAAADKAMTRRTGTYVYGLLAAPRQPGLGRGVVPKGLPATGPIRLLTVDGLVEPSLRKNLEISLHPSLRTWLVVADAPLDRYGEAAIKRGLGDLDWVARLAVAHEAVVESFPTASAVLPMKLFTIFANDDRALEHIVRDRARVHRLLAQVIDHQEWGVRIAIDRSGTALGSGGRNVRPARSGADYLEQKKAQRKAARELSTRAREIATDLYTALAEESRATRRRTANQLPIGNGPLLLDAAFLVGRRKSARFRQKVARRARELAPQGYRVSLSGPWPPYSFMQD